MYGTFSTDARTELRSIAKLGVREHQHRKQPERTEINLKMDVERQFLMFLEFLRPSPLDRI